MSHNISICGYGSRLSPGRRRIGAAAVTKTHKAWRLHAHNDLRFDEVETPKPAPDGVVVRIEAGMVLSYTGKVLSGSVPYSLPPMPFVPGTNAIARVIEAGSKSRMSGRRPRFPEPASARRCARPRAAADLIGLTAMAPTPAHWRCRRAGATACSRKCALAGGLRHAALRPRRQTGDRTDRTRKADRAVRRAAAHGLRGRQTIIINGATGYFGSGAVMLAVAMGAGRVVAVGRKQAALEVLRETFGPRVIPAVVSGEAAKDLADHPPRRRRRRRRRARPSRCRQEHVDHAVQPARAQARRPAGADGQRRGAARTLLPRDAGE